MPAFLSRDGVVPYLGTFRAVSLRLVLPLAATTLLVLPGCRQASRPSSGTPTTRQPDVQASQQKTAEDDAGGLTDVRGKAERGDAIAQRALGSMFEYGQGVPQDLAEAAKWYRKSAEQGDAGAQSLLGWMYREGRGVPRDDPEATRWFARSAESGDPLAPTNLAVMYERGEGVPSDLVEAHKWFNIAAMRATGDARARSENLRDGVARRMTPTQITEATKRARQWMTAFRRRHL